MNMHVLIQGLQMCWFNQNSGEITVWCLLCLMCYNWEHH